MSEKRTVILGIESSCDDTAAAVVVNGREILSSVAASQIDIHKKYGGVVPEIASRCHIEAIDAVVGEAIEKANIKKEEIDAIAVTAAPGLIGSLLVGVSYAKGLSYALDKPIVPVHHIRSHVASNYPANLELRPPFISLIASGGHSHIVLVKSYTEFEVVGRTRDDAAGECFDKTARVLGFPYPGGVYIDEASKNGNEKAFEFPKCKIEGSDLDFSFSGLKTAVINTVHKLNQQNKEVPINDIAACVQSSISNVLTEHLCIAAKKYGYNTVALAGGVAANSGLREAAMKMCEKNGFTLFLPPKSLCGDNGVMVASQGYYEFTAGVRGDLSLNACATMEISDSF